MYYTSGVSRIWKIFDEKNCGKLVCQINLNLIFAFVFVNINCVRILTHVNQPTKHFHWICVYAVPVFCLCWDCIFFFARVVFSLINMYILGALL